MDGGQILVPFFLVLFDEGIDLLLLGFVELGAALIHVNNFIKVIIVSFFENLESSLAADVYDFICFVDRFSFSLDHGCGCFFSLPQLGKNLSVQLLALLYLVKCHLKSPLEFDGLASLVGVICCSQFCLDVFSSLLLGLMVLLYIFIICFDQLGYLTSSGALCLYLLLCLFSSFPFLFFNFAAENLCLSGLGLLYPLLEFFFVLHHAFGEEFAFSMVLIDDFSGTLPSLELSVDPAELNGSRQVEPVSVRVKGGQFSIWH